MDVASMNCCGIKELDELSRIETTDWKGAWACMAEVKDCLTEEAHQGRLYDYDQGIYINTEWVEEVVHTPAFFIFSQAGTPTDVAGSPTGAYGDCFRDFIIEQGLGTVQETEPAFNENSKNLVKVFLWTVNQDVFKTWNAKTALKEHKKKVA